MTSPNPNHLPKFRAAHPITETGWGSSLWIQRDVIAPSITAPIALSSVPSTFQAWPLDSLKRELAGVFKCLFLILSAFYWSYTWVLVICPYEPPPHYGWTGLITSDSWTAFREKFGSENVLREQFYDIRVNSETIVIIKTKRSLEDTIS